MRCDVMSHIVSHCVTLCHMVGGGVGRWEVASDVRCRGEMTAGEGRDGWGRDGRGGSSKRWRQLCAAGYLKVERAVGRWVLWGTHPEALLGGGLGEDNLGLEEFGELARAVVCVIEVAYLLA